MIGKKRQVMKRVTLAVLLTAAVAATFVMVDSTFPGDSGAPDHLLVYEALAEASDEVVLNDQFGDDMKFNVGDLRGLGVPASKNSDFGYGYGYDSVNGPDHPDFHYTVYRIQPGEGEPVHENVSKIVEDQFGTLPVRVQGPNFLMVPAFKSLVEPAPNAPDGADLEENVIDHYTCYRASAEEPFSSQVVTVTDQFSDPMEVEVIEPASLCAPTAKIHNETEYPINNPLGEGGFHLMCYTIEPVDVDGGEDGEEGNGGNAERDVWVGDQFVQQQLVVNTKVLAGLCVPAEKSDPQ
jgi:hypothetical protein